MADVYEGIVKGLQEVIEYQKGERDLRKSDWVEVVRCKDCKFNYANQIPSENACQLCVELPISDEFYCAYGERIEDETD